MDRHIKAALERLETAAQLSKEMFGKPLEVCYSGGKDSQVIVRLAIMADIDFAVRHNVTTVDAPETIRTIRETFKRLEALGVRTDENHPDVTMWELIPQKRMPPTRLVRYCCEYLKERNAKSTFIATGVRRAESVRRGNRDTFDVVNKRRDLQEHYGDEVFLANDNSENRRIIERCQIKSTMCVNPIIDWSDLQVLRFYHESCEVHNPLYEMGFSRVGCIGCPMAPTRQRQKELSMWPQYRRAYIRAFGKMLEIRRECGLKVDDWETGEDVLHWWLSDGFDKNQLSIDFSEIGVDE